MIYLKGTIVKLKTRINLVECWKDDYKKFSKYFGKSLVVEEVLDRGLYYKLSYFGNTIDDNFSGDLIESEGSIGDLLTEHLIIQLEDKTKYILENINYRLCAINYQDCIDDINSIMDKIIEISKIVVPGSFYTIFYSKDESCLKRIWKRNSETLEITKEDLSKLLGMDPDKIIIK